MVTNKKRGVGVGMSQGGSNSNLTVTVGGTGTGATNLFIGSLNSAEVEAGYGMGMALGGHIGRRGFQNKSNNTNNTMTINGGGNSNHGSSNHGSVPTGSSNSNNEGGNNASNSLFSSVTGVKRSHSNTTIGGGSGSGDSQFNTATATAATKKKSSSGHFSVSNVVAASQFIFNTNTMSMGGGFSHIGEDSQVGGGGVSNTGFTTSSHMRSTNTNIQQGNQKSSSLFAQLNTKGKGTGSSSTSRSNNHLDKKKRMML